MKKIKIARVVTVPIVYTHILDLLDVLNRDERFELHIVCGQGHFLNELKALLPGAFFHYVEIPREINIISDLRALAHLTSLFLKERFDIVHSHTPKAGLVNAMAGFLTRTPVRIHTFTGQVWATMTGPKKKLLIFIDKIIGFLNTHNYADSFGQRQFLLNFNIGKEKTLSVLHKGSFGGVNAERFNLKRLAPEVQKLRQELFPDFTGKVLIFLGRMNNEKGLIELAEAFLKLKIKFQLKLLLVGPVESTNNPQFVELLKNLKEDKDVLFVSFTAVPEVYIGVGDIFCFPSYREGFGTVALEASSMEKPIVASNIYGLSEAISDRESGLLFESRNAKDLMAKLDELLSNNEYAEKLGKQGRARILKDYAEKILTEKMIEEYLVLTGN